MDLPALLAKLEGTPGGEDQQLDAVMNYYGTDVQGAARIMAAMAYAKNAGHAKPTPFQTQLDPAEEVAFQAWVKANFKSPEFETGNPFPDYDLRGFWKAMVAGKSTPKATSRGPTYGPEFETPFSFGFGPKSIYYMLTRNPNTLPPGGQ